MQIAQKAAEREHRGGVIARQRSVGVLAVLREHCLLCRLEVKTVLPALDAAGELVRQKRVQAVLRAGSRAQHCFGR